MISGFPHNRGKFFRATFGIVLSCLILSVAVNFPPRSAYAQGFVPVNDALLQAALVPTEEAQLVEETATTISTGKSLIESTLQTAKAYAQYFKEWVGDGLVTYIAKTALRGITKSIVNWINNDFHGSPSFVTNLEGFGRDLADQVIGRTLQEIDPALCEPFRLDIKLALGFQYSLQGGQDEYNCRLSDVLANVQGAYDSFVGGNFGSGGGWKNWVSIGGSPSSNPYGSYLSTVSKMDMSIMSATGKEMKILDFGDGFRSWRPCIDEDPDTGECYEEGEIQTPGALIQDQLSTAFDYDLEGLAVADEINEIVAALANHMIQKVMNGVGGVVRATDDNDGAVGGQTQTYDTQNCAQYRGFANTECVSARSRTTLTAQFTVDDASASAVASVARGTTAGRDSAQGVAFENTATGQNNALTAARLDTTRASVGVTIGNTQNNITNQNLAGSQNGMPKSTRQSSLAPCPELVPIDYHRHIPYSSCIGSFGPDKGNDGQWGGTPGPDTVVQTSTGLQQWWEVDLEEHYPIGEVRIFPRNDVGALDYLRTASLFISNSDTSNDQPAAPASGSWSKEIPITIPASYSAPNALKIDLSNENLTGRFIRIQRKDGVALSFAEVQVFQLQTAAKPIPQFINLTAGGLGGGTVTATKGIGASANERWKTGHPEFSAQKAIDGNTNGDFMEASKIPSSGGSLTGVLNPDATFTFDNTNWLYEDVGCRDVWRYWWNGNYYAPQNCMNRGVDFPWWQADLGASRNISAIKLWTRSDRKASETVANLYLFVTDNMPYLGGVAPADPDDWNSAIAIPVPDPSKPEPRPLTIPVNKNGRYLRLQKRTMGDPLWFSEIQIIGPSDQTQGSFARTQNNSDKIAVAVMSGNFTPPSANTSGEKAVLNNFTIKNIGTIPLDLEFATGFINAENSRTENIPFNLGNNSADIISATIAVIKTNPLSASPPAPPTPGICTTGIACVTWTCPKTLQNNVTGALETNCNDSPELAAKAGALQTTSGITLTPNETAYVFIRLASESKNFTSGTGIETTNRWELTPENKNFLLRTTITQKSGTQRIPLGAQLMSFR